MALQSLKDSKLPSSLCRLSPPSSPSKRASQGTSRGMSKLLAAFDAAMAVERKDVNNAAVARSAKGKSLALPKSNTGIHPFFLAAGVSKAQPLTESDSQPNSFSARQTSQKSAHRSVASTSRSNTTFGTSLPKSLVAVESENVPVPVPALPLYSFKQYKPEPTVVYIRHEDEANELVQSLTGPLGFDMEWRIFVRAKQTPIVRRTAVVQLCDTQLILVIQISEMKRFPQKVKEIIESPDIVKTGANIRNDGEKLFHDFGILAAGLVELGAFAHSTDPAFSSAYSRSIVSLVRMVERYTHKTLDKGKVRMSDWETKPLSPDQITYAANDAHCALMVYNQLAKIAAKHGRKLDPARYTCKITSTQPRKSPLPGSASSALAQATLTDVDQPAPPSSRHLQAYTLWHDRGMSLHEICATMRSKENPLAESTVISYVVRALEANPALSFSMERLKALVQLEAGSWARHRDWINTRER